MKQFCLFKKVVAPNPAYRPCHHPYPLRLLPFTPPPGLSASSPLLAPRWWTMIALASAVILRFSFMAEAIKIDKRGWRKVQSVFPTARSYDFSQLRRGTRKRKRKAWWVRDGFMSRFLQRIYLEERSSIQLIHCAHCMSKITLEVSAWK